MRIAEKQNSAFLLKTSVSIMDFTFSCGQTYFIEILSAVSLCGTAVSFYLEYIKAFQLQFLVELRNLAHVVVFHETKLRKSKRQDLLKFEMM